MAANINEEEHLKTHIDEGQTLNHGKNWYEGKKSTTLSFSEKYAKPTYIAEIKFKENDSVYLRMTDFDTSEDASSWINDKKTKINKSLSNTKIFQPMYSSGLVEKPLGKTYDDAFKDEIIEMPALYSLYHEEINNYSKEIEHMNVDFKGDKVTNTSSDHKASPAANNNKKGLGKLSDEKDNSSENREIIAPKEKYEEGIII